MSDHVCIDRGCRETPICLANLNLNDYRKYCFGCYYADGKPHKCVNVKRRPDQFRCDCLCTTANDPESREAHEKWLYDEVVRMAKRHARPQVSFLSRCYELWVRFRFRLSAIHQRFCIKWLER